MARAARRLIGMVVFATLLAVGVAPAEAAKRRVPFGFFGTVLPPEMSFPQVVPDERLEEQVALMASSGVESMRVTYSWDELEPAAGVYTWGALDRVAASAARHGISLVVNVTASSRWASARPNSPDWWRYGPSDPGTYAELMRQLVLRYGPNGALWVADPTLPQTPVRQWQIWNEQSAPWHWRTQPWARGYTRLLRAAYGAIHQADPGAQVIAGSLVAARADYAPWDAIRDLYRAGAKRWFDLVAVHPFTNNRRSVRLTVRQTVEILQRVRAQMRRRGDARKGLLVTEMTWPASAGKVPRRAQFGLETTRRGQAKRLAAAYRRLAQLRRRMRIREVHWYTWGTQYDRGGSLSVMTFRFSGLTRMRDGVFSALPILRTYRRVAARYQGCRKSANARVCR